MQTNISSKHMELTPAIEEYAVKKVEKFQRFFDRIQQVDVVIDRTRKNRLIYIRGGYSIRAW